MLHRMFDPKKPLRVVLYLRMSSAQQNPRSPDQQRDTITAAIKRLGYPWVVVAAYTDAGISGQYVTKRPEFQRMLREIRTGVHRIDAVAVDTFERFGRAEEMAAIRQELHRHHGVVVLTADSSFADPTSTSGQILAACESVRATDDNRVKAHNVLRGKRDAARLKHWPGGPPPFGYRLQSVLVERGGRQEVNHSVLVPDPATAPVVRALFRKAHETGWGCVRLARWLNDDPAVPSSCKPFTSQGVNASLSSPIYKGELVWERYATGVVDDRRVTEKNPDDRVVRVPGFCEPLVEPGVWDEVRRLRAARGERIRQARSVPAGSGKQIAPLVSGVALKYPLSGLVVCGECGLAMSPSSSRAYTTKGTGESKRYTAYLCGRSVDRLCPNATRIPEAWLRQTVLGLVRDRLFPADGRAGASWTPEVLERCTWFGPLVARVQAELDRQAEGRPDRRPAVEAEVADLRLKITGWRMSLGNPALDHEIRAALEEDTGTALGRVRALEADLAGLAAAATDARVLADPAAVADRLNRLADVVALDNPGRLNLELALHVEAIRCFPDGRVVVRTCKLGALAPAAGAAIREGEPTPAPAADPSGHGTPRKRSIRRLETEDAGPALRAVAHRAADVNRFAGLGAGWFWDDEFRVPEPTCWSKENAAAVAGLRAAGLTHEQLADEFGVTVPTIRKALGFAKGAGLLPDATPRKMARARWQDAHYREVAELRRQGRTLKQLAVHFGKSEPLIRAALALADAEDVGDVQSGT